MSSHVVFHATAASMRGSCAPVPVAKVQIDAELATLMDLTTGIPLPGIAPYRPNRKSHARKRPEGHIPRPKNAWIWFRSDFVWLQGKLKNDEKNQTALTQLASRMWASMTPEQKAPWDQLAQLEKDAHAKANPGYTFRPQAKSVERDSPVISAASASCRKSRASHDDDDYADSRRRSPRRLLRRRGAPLTRSGSTTSIETLPVLPSEWSLSSATVSSASSQWSTSPAADSMGWSTISPDSSFTWSDPASLMLHSDSLKSSPLSPFPEIHANVPMPQYGGLTGWTGAPIRNQVAAFRGALIPRRRTSSCPPPGNLIFNRALATGSPAFETDLSSHVSSISSGLSSLPFPLASAPILYAPAPRLAARDDESFERRPSLAHVMLNEQWAGGAVSFACGEHGVEATGVGAYDQRAGEMRLAGYWQMLGGDEPAFTYEISPTYGTEWPVPDGVVHQPEVAPLVHASPAAYVYGFDAPAVTTPAAYSALAHAPSAPAPEYGLRLDTSFAMPEATMLSAPSPVSSAMVLTPNDSLLDWQEWLHVPLAADDGLQLSPISMNPLSLSPIAQTSSLHGALG